MSDKFRLTLAQLNPTVGALAENAALAKTAWDAARERGSDMLALTEMFITGYQVQDLIRRRSFVRAAMAQIESLAASCIDGPALAIGGPWLDEQDRLFNAYYICQGGQITARVLKHRLPNNDVFDEVRHYTPGDITGPYVVGPIRIGSPICEDAWTPDVAEALAESGAEILLIPNGSPYHRGKQDERIQLMVNRVVETGLPLVYLNMVGGQDDQVFDGASFALNPGGHLALQMPVFDSQLSHLDFERGPEGWRAIKSDLATHPDTWEQDYRVMVIGLRDYLAKAGFKKVLLGLSGGIDSALVAAIACDALGAENVRCVMLPSEYTSTESLEDAAGVAQRLGCRLDEINIQGPRNAVSEALAPLFGDLPPDITEENIQSRLRGLLLMGLSNKFGEMLLTTGNKSEVAVGYATIYGDMAGGYNPIKDLYKTRVFETCRWRNAHHRPWMLGPEGEVIPPRVIDKPPTAELRPDQKDEDSLPPYEVLDRILEMLVDEEKSVSDVVEAGFSEVDAKRVEHLIYISEYKRYQAAPGARLTRRAFWLDRRYPIANRWREGSWG
ncbi:MAG: NAD+ synthase [Mangrovicoccus sp.]